MQGNNPNKKNTEESEIDLIKNDIRIEINEKRKKLYHYYFNLKTMIENLKEEIDSLADIESKLCNHSWVRDISYYQPCGSRPFICSKCGMYQ